MIRSARTMRSRTSKSRRRPRNDVRDALLEAGKASLVVLAFGRPPVTGSSPANRAAPDSLAPPHATRKGAVATPGE
jgi:hypothetical protein